MLKSICQYIQENDRNSNIMDAYEEMLDGALDQDSLVWICQRVLGEWKEDLQPLSKQVQGYFDYLGISTKEETMNNWREQWSNRYKLTNRSTEAQIVKWVEKHQPDYKNPILIAEHPKDGWVAYQEGGYEKM